MSTRYAKISVTYYNDDDDDDYTCTTELQKSHTDLVLYINKIYYYCVLCIIVGIQVIVAGTILCFFYFIYTFHSIR